MSLLRPLCALALLCLSQAACAQAYKCTVNGTTTYQDTPCADGKGTTLDLPGAFSPPGAIDGNTPEGTALGLSFTRLMVQRCPLGRTSSDRLDMIAMTLGPSLKSLGKTQMTAIYAKAAHYADVALASPKRAADCKSIDDAINSAFQSRAPATAARPAARQKPTPTL